MQGGKKMGLLKTGELIKESGFSRQTIYTYLTMGLISPKRTTPAGHNLFSKEVVNRLKLIHRLNESGYTLRDIRDIFFKDGR